jgi:hypothetical protein
MILGGLQSVYCKLPSTTRNVIFDKKKLQQNLGNLLKTSKPGAISYLCDH